MERTSTNHKNKEKMKISLIVKKVDKAKSLLKELSMLEALIKAMLRSRKDHPDELPIDETYYENVTKRLEKVKQELKEMFVWKEKT